MPEEKTVEIEKITLADDEAEENQKSDDSGAEPCTTVRPKSISRIMTEIRIRAERKTGMLLSDREMAKGMRLDGPRQSVDTTTETLADIGIIKDQSSRLSAPAQQSGPSLALSESRLLSNRLRAVAFRR